MYGYKFILFGIILNSSIICGQFSKKGIFTFGAITGNDVPKLWSKYQSSISTSLLSLSKKMYQINLYQILNGVINCKEITRETHFTKQFRNLIGFGHVIRTKNQKLDWVCKKLYLVQPKFFALFPGLIVLILKTLRMKQMALKH